MNVLITGVNGDIGFAVYNILLKRGDIKTLLCTDVTSYTLINKKKDYKKISHSDNKIQYLREIEELVSEHKIDLVIPTNEAEILMLSKFAKDFKIAPKILSHDPMLLDIFFSKSKSLNWIKQFNIPHGHFYDTNLYSHQLEFPYFLKRNSSSGGRGVFKLDDMFDFLYYSKKYPDSIVQEDLGQNNEYTISVFSYNEDFCFVVFERVLGYGGLSKWVKVNDNSVALDLVTMVNKHIGSVGSYNIQAINKGNQLKIIEINLRISSTLSIRNKINFDDLNWWIDYMFYDKRHVFINEYIGKEFVRTISDKSL
jgi:carbamoyl-phosphate synthase large subunit